MYLSIMTLESRRAVGLARSRPAMSGAVPCTACTLSYFSFYFIYLFIHFYHLKNGASKPDVTAGCEAETADEAGAKVGQDVAVQVGHHQHVVLTRVLGTQLQSLVAFF